MPSVAFRWCLLLSCQQQFSGRTLVNVCHARVQDPASLVLVLDSPEEPMPGNSPRLLLAYRQLLAASSLVLREDADSCRPNLQANSLPCLTFYVHLPKAQHLLILSCFLQGFNVEERVVPGHQCLMLQNRLRAEARTDLAGRVEWLHLPKQVCWNF